MFKQVGAVATAIGAIALAGCNPVAELGDADKEVAAFHEQFAAENYDAIWTGSHENLRKAGSREDFDRMMVGLRNYWGPMKSTEREGFNINTNNGVTEVQVTHNTTFENGEAVETFNFVREDEDLNLLGYDIKSAEAAKAEKEAEKEKEDAE